MPTQMGQKLKERRLELGLSLDELAKRSKTSKSYLWELENREKRKPSAEKLSEVANALEVTTGYLLDGKAEMDDDQLKEAFYRKFKRLNEGDRERIEDMINAWGKKT